MKQTARIISTYAGDTSGVCSALFELGGMTVMHDASGCNSTYNTHDEPRWYDMDSLVFVSGLAETEAILGDDGKLIDDTVNAAKELSPKFIALAGSPIPMMTGVDFPAVAREIEQKTGIPCFGFPADGMHSYIHGASMAFAALAERVCKIDVKKSDELSINILGATPLDFSINGTVEAMKKVIEDKGIKVNAVWSMGSELSAIENAGAATANLVVSASGLKAAEILKQRFGMPYVIGIPYGTQLTEKIFTAIQTAANTGETVSCCPPHPNSEIIIIGESITSLSLANALFLETGKGATVLCPVETAPNLLMDGCIAARDEDELLPYLEKAKRIIADPLYQPICPDTVQFCSLPHEAFSGRIYHSEMPELVTGFNTFKRGFVL